MSMIVINISGKSIRVRIFSKLWLTSAKYLGVRTEGARRVKVLCCLRLRHTLAASPPGGL